MRKGSWGKEEETKANRLFRGVEIVEPERSLLTDLVPLPTSRHTGVGVMEAFR